MCQANPNVIRGLTENHVSSIDTHQASLSHSFIGAGHQSFFLNHPIILSYFTSLRSPTSVNMFISVSLRVIGIFILACALTSSAIPVARTTNRFRRELQERSSLLNEDFLLQTRAIHEGCYDYKPRLSRRASSSGNGRRTPPDGPKTPSPPTTPHSHNPHASVEGYIPFLIPSPSGSQRSSQSDLHAQPQPHHHHQIAPLRYQLAPSQHPQAAPQQQLPPLQHPQPAQPLAPGRRPLKSDPASAAHRHVRIYGDPSASSSSSSNSGGAGPSTSMRGAAPGAQPAGPPVRPAAHPPFGVLRTLGIDERSGPVPQTSADVRPERRFPAVTGSKPASSHNHIKKHGKDKRSFGEGFESQVASFKATVDKLERKHVGINSMTYSKHGKWFNFKSIRGVLDILPGRSDSKRPLVEELANPPKAQSLPPELIIEILHYLRDDHPTLGQCCLVASSWLDISRHYLYYNAIFSISLRYKNFSSTYHYLERSMGVCKHIKYLHLHCHDHDFNEPLKKPAICDHILGAILKKLPNLMYVKIANVRFVHTPSPPYRWSLKHLLKPASRGEDETEKFGMFGDAQTLGDDCAFKHLHQQTFSTKEKTREQIPSVHLVFSDIGAEEDQDFSFREILRLFPSYISFDITPPRNPLISLVAPPSPHRVELTSEQELLWTFRGFERAAATFNSNSASYGTMRFLRIGLATLEHFQNAVRIISEVNPDLEHLSIDPTTMFEDALLIVNHIDWHQLNLSRFASLKLIYLQVDYADLITYQPNASLDGRAYLLCSYPSLLISALPRNVKAVAIGIHLREEDVDDLISFVQWDVLQSELLRLPDLEKVYFEKIEWEPQPPPLAKTRNLGIREKLPLLSRVLEVGDEPLSDAEESSYS
ncbi:hypothetical protein ABKN59_011873 [Abortiporus biennis]